MMLKIRVPDMSCAHCVQTITETLKSLDPAVTLNFDLAQYTVMVKSARSQDDILLAIKTAGYTPEIDA